MICTVQCAPARACSCSVARAPQHPSCRSAALVVCACAARALLRSLRACLTSAARALSSPTRPPLQGAPRRPRAANATGVHGPKLTASQHDWPGGRTRTRWWKGRGRALRPVDAAGGAGCCVAKDAERICAHEEQHAARSVRHGAPQGKESKEAAHKGGRACRRVPAALDPGERQL